MAISYLLAPIPKWVIMNNEGEAAGGAKMYTYRSLNKIQQKAVYQDPAGTIPYTNPIIFDANGTEGPFYWETNSADLDDTYYLEVYDSDDNLLFTIDDYFPPGAGGGGNTTTYVPLNNLIANNTFIDQIDDTANPTNTTNLVLCPSNHHGFTPDLVNPVVGTFGVVGPDIRFVKNNTAATDQITFPQFALGSDPLTGDVTPTHYLRYQCTNSPVGETYKAFQFPIIQKINNLDNQVMTFTLWARVAVTPVNIVLYTRQYFGSGGVPSAEVRTSAGTLSLTTTWTKYLVGFTVPNTAGKTLGTCGDDALYLQLEMPLGAPCDVWFIKPTLYNGTINPTLDFQTYDETDAIIQSPRTADFKFSYRNNTPPRGWIWKDDGSIGNVGSAATNRANNDTFFLYKTLWDCVSDTYAPVSTGRGASAVADFSAGKTITLPRTLGRAFASDGAGAGLTARTLGEFVGAETHVLTIPEMPAHNHPGSTVGAVDTGGGASNAVRQAGAGATDNVTVTVASQGSNTAHNIMQPTSFLTGFLKL